MARTGRIALRAGLAATALVMLAVGVGPWTGAYRTATVLTGSMRPGMPPGSVAILRPVAPSAIRVGDVVTYEAPIPDRRVVTHRVVRIVSSGPQPVIQTKGDANHDVDPWLARLTSAPAWRRQLVIPHLGTVIRLLRSPRVHLATVYGAPALLIICWLAKIWAREPRPEYIPCENRRVCTPDRRGALLGLAVIAAAWLVARPRARTA